MIYGDKENSVISIKKKKKWSYLKNWSLHRKEQIQNLLQIQFTSPAFMYVTV